MPIINERRVYILVEMQGIYWVLSSWFRDEQFTE
nr:MAG TPA: hypothetical protein [Bacteriophage sp.]